MLSWLVILLIVSVLIVAAGSIYLIRTGRGKGDRPDLIVTRFGAIAFAVLTAIGTTVAVIQTLVAEHVAVSLPVSTFWPNLHPTVEITDGPTAEVVGGGFEVAEVTIAGLSTDARLLLAGGHALQGLTFVIIGVMVAILCHRLLAGDPFRRMLSRAMTVSAVSIAIGGLAWQVLFQLGGLAASTQVLLVTGWNAGDVVMQDPDIGIGWPEPYMGFTLEFWPLFLALPLVAVAIAFRYGERLQRDTEGLV